MASFVPFFAERRRIEVLGDDLELIYGEVSISGRVPRQIRGERRRSRSESMRSMGRGGEMVVKIDGEQMATVTKKVESA